MKLLPDSISQWLARRFNPILVKELRQGVRSRAYTLVFLIVQVVMVFYLIFGMAVKESGGSNNSELDAFFWIIVGGFLLGILPLMGSGALSSENRGSRLELMVLTRLTARRIVYGKWLAIVAQGTLIVMALLPYLVLRYYIGSVEFHESLLIALILLAASAILTGLTVSVSVIRSPLVRWFLLVVGGLWTIPALIGLLVQSFRQMSDLLAQIPLILLSGGLLVALAMEFAAARFSPIEENHDTPKRLILLLMLLVGAGSYAWDDDLVMPNILFWIGFLFVSWDGLCRPASASPSVYEPFVRLGWAGRMAGRLLYPGWASSVVFSLVTFGLFLFGLVWGGETMGNEDIEIIRLLIGAFLFPFAVLLWVGLGRRFFGLSMFLFQLGLVLIMVLLHLFDEFGHTHLTLAACWSPTSVLVLYIMEDLGDANLPYRDVYMIASLVMTALSLVAIAIKAFPQRRLVIRMEKQARANRQARSARESVVAPPVLETSS
ncbi:MAG: hypothetical protein Q7Q73_19400 [Verrucomicrobiota bacterium JB024]|nr:hypothetical protein [Verrucomicrobiota bacterium JB024]